MVDALLVFSPLQEICFFVLRSPYLDQIGVAPLLRRRLVGLQSVNFAGFSKYVSSPRLLRLCLQPSPCGTFYISLTSPVPSALRLLLRFSLTLRTLRRSVLTFELLAFTCFNS